MIPITSLPLSFSDMLSVFTVPSGINQFGIMTNSGSSALAIALNHIPRSTRKIAVSAYTCPVVYDIIKLCDFTPVLVDTEPDSYDLNRVALEQITKTRAVDAVITTHMFGKKVLDIRSICYNVPIIEDSCHYIDPNSTNGSDYDFRFYSFGLGKVITCGYGGALRINNKVAGVIEFDSETSVIGALFKLAEMKFGTTPSLYEFIQPRSLVESKEAVKLNIKKLNPRVQDMLNLQLKRLPALILERARKVHILADILHRNIDFSNNIFMRFVIQTKNAQRAVQELFKSGIEAEMPYQSLLNVIPQDLCPNSYRFIRENLSIPIHHGVQDKDVFKIGYILNQLSV